jgi:BMFP domain-containing protein YqiC
MGGKTPVLRGPCQENLCQVKLLVIKTARKEIPMAQTDNPFLDGVAKAFTDAAGMAQSVRTEIDTFMRQRLERLVADMDFVPREEFEAVKAMAAKARAENETLEARIAALESKSGT